MPTRPPTWDETTEENGPSWEDTQPDVSGSARPSFDPSKIPLNPYDASFLKYGKLDPFGARDTDLTEALGRTIAPHITGNPHPSAQQMIADLALSPLRASSIPFEFVPHQVMDTVENVATDAANIPFIGLGMDAPFQPGKPVLPKMDIPEYDSVIRSAMHAPEEIYNQLSEMTTPGNIALAGAFHKAGPVMDYMRANPPSMALAKELSRAAQAPLDIPESTPDPMRRLGIQMPWENPFLNPEIRNIAGQALDEAQGGKIMAPGQEPALLNLRRQFQPQIEPVTIARADRPGGGPATGGQISFAAPAEAGGIPNAAQAAIPTGDIMMPDLVDRILAKIARGEPVTGPEAPSYRRPSPAPTAREAELRQQRANVEAGLTIPEQAGTTELPIAREGQYPAEGGPTGTLSNLQRQRMLAGKENVRAIEQNNPPMAGPAKQSFLDAADAKLAEWQKNIRGGQSFTGITGLEVPIADAAIMAARAAIKATKSIAAGVEAAIEYIRANHPDVKFDENKLRGEITGQLSGLAESEQAIGEKNLPRNDRTQVVKDMESASPVQLLNLDIGLHDDALARNAFRSNPEGRKMLDENRSVKRAALEYLKSGKGNPEEIINNLKNDQQIHKDYLSGRYKMSRGTGGKEWQQSWIKAYDKIIDAIQSKTGDQNATSIRPQPEGSVEQHQGTSLGENLRPDETQIRGSQGAEAVGGNRADEGRTVQPQAVADPAPEQLGKYKESSGRLSWTPDYFEKAGDNVFNPDWWTGVFDKVAGDSKIDGTGTAYQIGKFIRSLGNERGNLVIDALEKTREKMSGDIDLIKKDFKGATQDQISRAMKWGTGGIQLPREAWESALDIKSAKGELPGEPIVRSGPQLQVEGVTSLDPASGTPLSATDALINKLESMRVKGGVPGMAMMGPHPDLFKSYGSALWNTAIDIAIQGVKAGKAVKDAIGDAISHLKKNSNNVDEAQVRAQMEYVLNQESKSAGSPAAAAAPGTAGTTSPGAPAAAPGAGGTPPAPGTPAGGARGATTLDDIYRIFEHTKAAGKGIGQRLSEAVEAFRTGLSSKFRPLDKLAEDIGKAYGVTKQGVAGIFEQLKGSSGKGEADMYRFDRDVTDLVKGSEKDFSPYMFLRRSIDRLQQDLADLQKAQAGGSVPKLNRRAVSNYTIPELQAKLSLLEQKLGPEKVAKFRQAAEMFQQHMDKALRLQVDSGRMSPEVYNAIKSGNQFYAPFKVMKYIEETMRPEGSGARIDTLADYTKAMQGIEDPNFKLGDMLAAARQNIVLSRILAEKNYAMRNISDLAAIDTAGRFVKKLAPKRGQIPAQSAPKGMEVVNVLEGGKPVRYAVDPTLSQAVQIYGQQANNVISRLLGYGSQPFRAGATALNIPFQVSNILADAPRQALVSKYGVRGVADLVRYPLNFIQSIFASMQADVLGNENPVLRAATKLDPTGLAEKFRKANESLYLDFLDSGAAGSTVQESLTPKALTAKPQSLIGKAAHGVLWALPDFAQAIEQTSKILGVKRAMDFHGVSSGAELARRIPEAVTEIRRFSGSPDFGRQGKWVEQARLNILYMFLNARIQGAVADVGRLTGRDGAATATKTWGKVLTAVGLPTAYLYLMNNSSKYAADYAQRPDQEKQNYWLIPKDTFIKAADGSQIRDYWRIPKRESSKWIANMVESGLNFAENRTPDTFGKWAQSMMEDISPVNIQGNNFQERLESTASSLNPLVKTPLEVATGRDLYRHKNIVPDTMKKASPELQYTDRTAEVFKQAADAMPGVAPEFMRSPLMLENMTRNLTAGLITQFLPRKPVEGRTDLENQPLLSRFQALPYTDSSAFDNQMKSLERESADVQLTRFRNADQMLTDNKGKPIEDIVQKTVAKYGPDEKMVNRVVDLWTAEERGITPQERRILALPVEQRAKFIANEMKSVKPELREEAIRNLALKRIFTESVAEEMAKQSQ